MLFAVGGLKATQIKIGDLHSGVPELRADSRYNIDTDVITKHFSIGVDVLTVIVESAPQGVHRLRHHDQRSTASSGTCATLPGVQSVLGIADSGEGHQRRLERRGLEVARAAPEPLDHGPGGHLYRYHHRPCSTRDCSVMPVYIYTTDHKAETIDRIVTAVKEYRAEHDSET